MQVEVLSTIFALNTSVMLALGTGLIVLITVAGVGLGFAGGWFCFKYARRKNIFNDTDREYFQNLLFRAETAEEKLTKTELNLAKTGDRADILESSHRVIQEELAEERQNSQMLTAELTRERATRKTIEETIETQMSQLIEAGLAEALAVDDELPARMKFTKEGVRPELAAERQGAGENRRQGDEAPRTRKGKVRRRHSRSSAARR